MDRVNTNQVSNVRMEKIDEVNRNKNTGARRFMNRIVKIDSEELEFGRNGSLH